MLAPPRPARRFSLYLQTRPPSSLEMVFVAIEFAFFLPGNQTVIRKSFS
jgi:hypothetical protein